MTKTIEKWQIWKQPDGRCFEVVDTGTGVARCVMLNEDDPHQARFMAQPSAILSECTEVDQSLFSHELVIGRTDIGSRIVRVGTRQELMELAHQDAKEESEQFEALEDGASAGKIRWTVRERS